MDWEDLRHFLALAQAGSLSEAARRLQVDHTTVARRVAALETALAVRLIDRLPRAVILTEEGRRIAALGEGMTDPALAILRAAHGADLGLHGEVRISAPPVFASIVIAPRLAMLRDRHPGIVIDLVGDVQQADLDRRDADIALRLSCPTGDGLVVRKLGEMAFALYAAIGYDRRNQAAWEFIGHDGRPPLPQQAWLDRIAQGRPTVFRSNDSASQAAAARAGLGVALLPHFLGDPDLALTRLPSPEPPPQRDIWLAVHDDLRRAPRIRAVMDFLAEGI